MNENIKVLLQKIAEDESLTAKFKACQNVDEAYAVASGVADGFTKEEFVAAMKELKASAANNGDLSEEDLAKMSGGFVSDVLYSIGTLFTLIDT